MIRGVEFLVPQTDPDILHQVLGCIDVKSYDWEVSEKGIDTWGVFLRQAPLQRRGICRKDQRAALHHRKQITGVPHRRNRQRSHVL